MSKPLEVTLWARLKQLLGGLLLYNTIYWRRASDGLKPPKLTPEERKSLAPPKDFEVIKPREKPRARLDAVKRRQRAEELAQVRLKFPRSVSHDSPVPEPEGREEVRPMPSGREGPADGFQRTLPTGVKVLKRRRKHRVHRVAPENVPSQGFFARIFGR